jgi:hypothetical protein
MNRELQESYNALSANEKEMLLGRFKNSPVMEKLIGYLDTSHKGNFKNSEAVKAIYNIEKYNKEYGRYENSYFKLRKKLFEEIKTPVKTDEGFLTAEEQEFFNARKMITQGKQMDAYTLLTKIEKHCWANNIFELLPQTIDLMILINQHFSRLQTNEKLYERLETAIKLRADMQRLALLSRHVYEINFKRGVKYAEKELDEMATLAAKHADYPRFRMAYNFVAAYYKLGSGGHGYNNMNIIGRHLSTLNKIHKEHPLMPAVMYTINYSVNQGYHFREIQMFFYFRTLKFKEAARILTDLHDEVYKEGSAHSQTRHETLYINMLHAYSASEDEKQLTKAADSFIRFIIDNNKQDRLPYAYAQIASGYNDAFPNTAALDGKFLLKMLDEYISSVKKDSDELGDLLLNKARLLCTLGQYELLKKVTDNKRLSPFFNDGQEGKLYKEYFDLLQNPTKPGIKTIKKIEELTSQTRSLKAATRQAVPFIRLRWLERVLVKEKERLSAALV